MFNLSLSLRSQELSSSSCYNNTATRKATASGGCMCPVFQPTGFSFSPQSLKSPSSWMNGQENGNMFLKHTHTQLLTLSLSPEASGQCVYVCICVSKQAKMVGTWNRRPAKKYRRGVISFYFIFLLSLYTPRSSSDFGPLFHEAFRPEWKER